jgi:5-formyltetrahydrofolate cyclo-ligase
MSPEEKEHQSGILSARLLADPELGDLRRLGIFLPLPDEPDLRPAYSKLLECGIELAVPFSTDSVHWNFHLIQELIPYRSCADTGSTKNFPVINPKDLQTILVPGRGFTTDGSRLGRGGGIYDRLLADTSARTIGIAFSCQQLPELPTDSHDIPLHEVWFA